MKIGDCSQFAVEFQLDENYGDIWLYGKFCYWINQKCIGDYEMGTSLRDILLQLKYIVGDNGNRNDEGLFSLGKEEVYDRLNCALYGYGSSEFEDKARAESWARFNVTLPVDIFDGWKIFIIENSEKTRVIARDIENDEIFEFALFPKEFDNVINRLYLELGKIYDLESKKEVL